MKLYIYGRLVKDVKTDVHDFNKDEWVLCYVLLGSEDHYNVIAIYNTDYEANFNNVIVKLCDIALPLDTYLADAEVFTDSSNMEDILHFFKHSINHFICMKKSEENNKKVNDSINNIDIIYPDQESQPEPNYDSSLCPPESDHVTITCENNPILRALYDAVDENDEDYNKEAHKEFFRSVIEDMMKESIENPRD